MAEKCPAAWREPCAGAADGGVVRVPRAGTGTGRYEVLKVVVRVVPRVDPPSSSDGLFPRPRRVVAPGAVHVPEWLSVDRRRELVAACRQWARGPVPLRHTVLPGGGVMSVRTVCLGWHWQPYRYGRTADDVNGARVAPFPEWLADLGRAAVAEAYGDADAAASFAPDTALINFYDGAAKMGMHQDKEERSGAPVVSLSVGDTCVFRFGNTQDRGRPYTDVELASGDLFVFGGPSRFAFHGVPKVYPGTAGPAAGLRAGRLNVTLRETGLHERPGAGGGRPRSAPFA